MPIAKKKKTTTHSQRGKQRKSSRPRGRDNRVTLTTSRIRGTKRRNRKSRGTAPTLMEALMMGGTL